LKKELGELANTIKSNKESFFKNLVLYRMNVDGDEELVRDRLSRMAKIDKGDMMNYSKFVDHRFYEDAYNYLQQGLDFENRYYNRYIKPKILEELEDVLDFKIRQLVDERKELKDDMLELSKLKEEELKMRKELFSGEYYLNKYMTQAAHIEIELQETTKNIDKYKKLVIERRKKLEDATSKLNEHQINIQPKRRKLLNKRRK
jgi:hypothetical protein